MLQDFKDDGIQRREGWGISVGCHPSAVYAEEKERKILNKLDELHQEKRLFAIGEIGKYQHERFQLLLTNCQSAPIFLLYTIYISITSFLRH